MKEGVAGYGVAEANGGHDAAHPCRFDRPEMTKETNGRLSSQQQK
jgi:hypothetical protein